MNVEFAGEPADRTSCAFSPEQADERGAPNSVVDASDEVRLHEALLRSRSRGFPADGTVDEVEHPRNRALWL